MHEWSLFRLSLALVFSFITSTLWGRELQQILDSKRLIVTLTEHDYAPFYSGIKLSGFDVELARQIADQLKVELELRREKASFPSFVKLLQEDKTDLIISAYQITLERAKYIKFSKSYFTEKRVFITKKTNNDRVKDNLLKMQQNGIPTITVGLLEKSTHRNAFLAKYRGAKVIYYATPELLMRAVKSGTVLFGYLSESIVNQWFREHNQDLLYLSKYFRAGETDDIGIGISPKSDQLFSWINHFIKIKQKDQSLLELAKKYFNENEFKNIEL